MLSILKIYHLVAVNKKTGLHLQNDLKDWSYYGSSWIRKCLLSSERWRVRVFTFWRRI